MTNWIKKINFSVIIIVVVSAIQYVNDICLHNLMLYILNYFYLVGLLILTIGFLWNYETEKIFPPDDNQGIEQKIREKVDAKITMKQIELKNYLKEQYIHNEIDNL